MDFARCTTGKIFPPHPTPLPPPNIPHIGDLFRKHGTYHIDFSNVFKGLTPPGLCTHQISVLKGHCVPLPTTFTLIPYPLQLLCSLTHYSYCISLHVTVAVFYYPLQLLCSLKTTTKTTTTTKQLRKTRITTKIKATEGFLLPVEQKL